VAAAIKSRHNGIEESWHRQRRRLAARRRGGGEMAAWHGKTTSAREISAAAPASMQLIENGSASSGMAAKIGAHRRRMATLAGAAAWRVSRRKSRVHRSPRLRSRWRKMLSRRAEIKRRCERSWRRRRRRAARRQATGVGGVAAASLWLQRLAALRQRVGRAAGVCWRAAYYLENHRQRCGA
jgi:hypothetical protein